MQLRLKLQTLSTIRSVNHGSFRIALICLSSLRFLNYLPSDLKVCHESLFQPTSSDSYKLWLISIASQKRSKAQIGHYLVWSISIFLCNYNTTYRWQLFVENVEVFRSPRIPRCFYNVYETIKQTTSVLDERSA